MVTYQGTEERIAKKKYYKINEKIRYPEVRVISSDGENIGVLDTRDAVVRAREENLDLVVITESAKPPVAKILDFNKFLYEENKKESHAKAKSKKSETKEFRVGAQIDMGAIDMKAKRAKEFIEEGNRVKITVTLRGRQKARPEIGVQKVERFIELLEDIAKPESEIRKAGNFITVVLVKK